MTQTQTTRQSIDSAIQNLLLNRGNPDVQAILTAGLGATPEQRRAIAEKYLDPFFAGQSEFANALLDKVLDIASDKEKLDQLEKHVSGVPLPSTDFDPGKFLQQAEETITGGDQMPQGLRPSAEIPSASTSSTTSGEMHAEQTYDIELPNTPPPPPPPPPIPGMQISAPKPQPADQGDYISGQLESSKAPQQSQQPKQQPEQQPQQTPREAKEQGLDQKKQQEQMQQFTDELAQNLLEQEAEKEKKSLQDIVIKKPDVKGIITPKNVILASVAGGTAVAGITAVLGISSSI